MPAISVIIPLYNKEKCISETIQSVLNQSFSDFELLIVNDGSTDCSLDIVTHIQDKRIKIFNKQNGGVSSARNYGVIQATSDWVIFLDADDIMLSNNLEVLFSLLCVYNTDIATASYLTYKKGKYVPTNYRKYQGVINNNLRSYYMDKFNMRMGCSIIKTSVMKRFPFLEHLNRFEDLCNIIELCKYCSISVSPTPILIYTVEFQSLSKRINIDSDFTFHLRFENKDIWEKMILGQLLVFISYNRSYSKIIQEKYGVFYVYRHFAFIGFKLKKIFRYIYERNPF